LPPVRRSNPDPIITSASTQPARRRFGVALLPISCRSLYYDTSVAVNTQLSVSLICTTAPTNPRIRNRHNRQHGQKSCRDWLTVPSPPDHCADGFRKRSKSSSTAPSLKIGRRNKGLLESVTVSKAAASTKGTRPVFLTVPLCRQTYRAVSSSDPVTGISWIDITTTGIEYLPTPGTMIL